MLFSGFSDTSVACKTTGVELSKIIEKWSDIEILKLFLTLLPKDTKIEDIQKLFESNVGIQRATEAWYEQKDDIKRIFHDFEENNLSWEERKYFLRRIVKMDNRSWKIEKPEEDVKTFKMFCNMISKRKDSDVNKILYEGLYNMNIERLTWEDISKIDVLLQECEKMQFTKEKRMEYLKNLIVFNTEHRYINEKKFISIDIELFDALYDIISKTKEDKNISLYWPNITPIIEKWDEEDIKKLKEIIKLLNKTKITPEEKILFLKYWIALCQRGDYSYSSSTMTITNNDKRYTFMETWNIDIFKMFLSLVRGYTYKSKQEIFKKLNEILAMGRLYSTVKDGEKYLNIRLKKIKKAFSENELMDFIRLWGIYLDYDKKINIKDIEQFDKTYKKISNSGLWEEFDNFLKEKSHYFVWKHPYNMDIFSYLVSKIDIKDKEVFDKIFGFLSDSSYQWNMFGLVKVFDQWLLKNISGEKKIEYLNELKTIINGMSNATPEKIKENMTFVVSTYLQWVNTKERVKYIKTLEEANPRRSILNDMEKERFSEIYNYLPADISLEEKFSIISSLREIICGGDSKKLNETMDIIKTYGVDNNSEILRLWKILLDNNKENLYIILNKIKRSKKNITKNLKKLENIICSTNTNNLQIIINTICSGNNTEENTTNLIRLEKVICNANTNNLQIIIETRCSSNNTEENITNLKKLDYILQNYKRNYLRIVLNLFDDKKNEISIEKQVDYLKNMENLYKKYGNSTENVEEFVKNIKEQKKWFYYGYFTEAVKNSIDVENNNINRENF